MSINITEGSGKVIGAETISSTEYQLVKLIDATAASVTRTGVAANPLQVSLANHAANATAVKVDGSAVTQPVSGTVTITPSGTQTVSGTVAATQSGTWTVQPGNTANTTAWKVDGSAVTQPVSIATAPVLVAGTALIGKVGLDQTTPGTTNAVSLAQIGGTTIVNGGLAGSQSVGGTVATNVAITDNPINTGGQAVSSENTAVTTARKVQFVADLVGKQIVLPYANPENFVSGGTAAMTGTTSTSVIAAPAAGLRNYVTQILVTNSHATVGTFVNIQDGSGGTVLYSGYAAPAGGGFSLTFPTPLRQPTTATAIYCVNVTTGSNTVVYASGYKGA